MLGTQHTPPVAGIGAQGCLRSVGPGTVPQIKNDAPELAQAHPHSENTVLVQGPTHPQLSVCGGPLSQLWGCATGRRQPNAYYGTVT